MVKLSSDVMVIGGGPAGAIAARTLSEQKIDTILIERKSESPKNREIFGGTGLDNSKPCGGGIPSPAFREFMIPEDVVKKQVDSIEIISPSEKRLSITLRGGNISIVNRAEFDPLLRSDAVSKGTRLIEAEFVSFLETSPSVKVLLRRNDGESVELTSRYAIVSDGVNSRARASLGLKPVNSVFTLSMRFSEVKNNKCEFWFGSEHAPGFYSWVFPLSAGTGSAGGDNIKDRFYLFCRKRGLSADGSLRGYRIPLWSLRNFVLQYNSSILFAGDAAGLVMPLTFEGIYYAMASGKMAAEAIIEQKPSGYKKLWKEKYLRRFSLMKFLWRYFLRNDKAVEKLIDMHRIPEVQEVAMELWLRKSVDKKSLNSYVKLFRRFIGIKA